MAAILISMADKLLDGEEVVIEESGAQEEDNTKREASCKEAGVKAEQMGIAVNNEVAKDPAAASTVVRKGIYLESALSPDNKEIMEAIEEIGVATDTTVEMEEAAARETTGIDHNGRIAGKGVITDEYLQNCEI